MAPFFAILDDIFDDIIQLLLHAEIVSICILIYRNFAIYTREQEVRQVCWHIQPAAAARVKSPAALRIASLMPCCLWQY